MTALIVNADDFGHDTASTDSTVECFRAGRITSATLMVYMLDSQRAAALAREVGIPIGLHLNLTEFFDACPVPEVRLTQARVVRRFAGWRLRVQRWIYDPMIAPAVRRSIGQQLVEFRRLVGREPTHIDGHNHVHLCPAVALSHALPRGALLRGTMPVHVGTGVMNFARSARERLLFRRFSTPALGVDISQAGAEMDGLVEGTGAQVVEVMCHPGFPEELAILESELWSDALATYSLTSYGGLGHARPISDTP